MGIKSKLQTNPGTGTDNISSGNITTAANGDTIVSGLIDASQFSAVGTGYTLFPGVTIATDFNYLEYKTQASAGAVAGTWTDSVGGGSELTATAIMAFKAADTLMAQISM